jgi:hypothetical protein
LMILMKTWMVNTISKTNWINQLKTLFFRVFFCLNTTSFKTCLVPVTSWQFDSLSENNKKMKKIIFAFAFTSLGNCQSLTLTIKNRFKLLSTERNKRQSNGNSKCSFHHDG